MNDEQDEMGERGLPDRLRELERRLEEMERGSKLRERAKSRFDRVVPPEAMSHFRTAGREQLMGIRTLMDHWIGRIDDMDARAKPTERETIEIR
jgi:hypothetical protein